MGKAPRLQGRCALGAISTCLVSVLLLSKCSLTAVSDTLASVPCRVAACKEGGLLRRGKGVVPCKRRGRTVYDGQP